MPLSIENLSEIMCIERAVFDFPWSASLMRDSLLAAHTHVWGLFVAAQMIGFGVLSIVLDESEVLDVALHPEYQGAGYGKILIQFLSNKARENGAKKMYLEVGVTNEVALHIYYQLKFQKIAFRRGYYPSKYSEREDAFLLECHL